jgi:hypothetical protein
VNAVAPKARRRLEKQKNRILSVNCGSVTSLIAQRSDQESAPKSNAHSIGVKLVEKGMIISSKGERRRRIGE